MKTPSSKTFKKHFSERQFEEFTISILASLARHLREVVHQERFFRKCSEDNFAKLERLVELHNDYSRRVVDCDAELAAEKQEALAAGEELDVHFEGQQFLRRLDAGLFTLQLIDFLIGEICRFFGEPVSLLHISFRSS